MPDSKKRGAKLIKISDEPGHSNYFALRYTAAQMKKINWFIENTELTAADVVREGTMILIDALHREEKWAMEWARRLREERGLK